MPNYAAIPEFGQLVEYITQGPLVDGTYGVIINRVKLESIITPIVMASQTVAGNLPSLQAANADYAKINAISADRNPILSPAELTPVKSVIATNNHTDIVRYATDTTPTGEVVTGKLIEVEQRPMWASGLAVTVGQVYRYETDKNLYEVIQAHTTQADWTPPVAKSLFKRFYEPSGATWPWVQPTGAHDAYPVGARVTHGGYTWQNVTPANVWVPGTGTLWTNLTPPPPTSAWSGASVAYKVNDLATYLGHTYKCLQAHTSNVSWTPTATINVLWQLVS